MYQDGNTIQDRHTKEGKNMDKGRSGMIMEAYTLGDSRKDNGLKGRSTSCKQMALTHSSIIQAIKKLVKVIKWCEHNFHF
jgi:hypothetical protein